MIWHRYCSDETSLAKYDEGDMTVPFSLGEEWDDTRVTHECDHESYYYLPS